jgi:hypothetical protein
MKLENLTKDKHSSLLRIFANYKQKSSIILPLGPNVVNLYLYKASVCLTGLENLAKDKHSSLLRMFANY